jgi:menaquinone-dependent protoporphyrinogen oxidase
MSNHHILIIYATSYGQTAKIALRMRDQLVAEGHAVEVANVDDMPPSPDLSAVDGVIICGSVIRGRHSRRLEAYVAQNRNLLHDVTSAFCSVSGSAGSSRPEEREEAERMLERFLHDTAWRPTMHATFAGAMAFTKYSWLVRWMMRRISAKEGGPTDTSRDHELTDWASVEAFTRQFATVLGSPMVASAVAHAPETREVQ